MRAAVLLLALFPAILAAQESSPDSLLKRAIDEQQRGDYASAIADYHKVLQSRPNDVEAQVNLGAALSHEGKYDDTIEIYRATLPLLKNKNMVVLNLALAYYKKGDFEHAREQFAVLHDAQPSNVRSIILLADSDLHLNRNDSALNLLKPIESKYSGEHGF